MPLLYRYMGLLVLFYANEHEPVHVHAKCQGRESKAEIFLDNGELVEIRYSDTPGKAPLSIAETQYFHELVSAHAMDIVQKWVDFFVLHKHVAPTTITRRLK
jgi:hypothetical protein